MDVCREWWLSSAEANSCQAAPSYPIPHPPYPPPRVAGRTSATTDLGSHPGPANWDQASVFTSRPQFALLLSAGIVVAASKGWSESSGETYVKCLVQSVGLAGAQEM